MIDFLPPCFELTKLALPGWSILWVERQMGQCLRWKLGLRNMGDHPRSQYVQPHIKGRWQLNPSTESLDPICCCTEQASLFEFLLKILLVCIEDNLPNEFTSHLESLPSITWKQNLYIPFHTCRKHSYIYQLRETNVLSICDLYLRNYIDIIPSGMVFQS